jgi:phage baseplate assembly protein gpV
MIKYDSIYRGTVKAHGDHGRCQIYVPGVYRAEDANASFLPWAEPAQGLFAGCAEGQGVFQYPLIDSSVWVFFENGDHHFPIFFAAALGGTDAKPNFVKDKYIVKTNTSTITIDDTTGAIVISTDTSHTTTVPTITINASSSVIINSPSVKVNSGTITVTGGDVIADGISLKGHVHSQGNDNDGDAQVNTNPPV